MKTLKASILTFRADSIEQHNFFPYTEFKDLNGIIPTLSTASVKENPSLKGTAKFTVLGAGENKLQSLILDLNPTLLKIGEDSLPKNSKDFNSTQILMKDANGKEIASFLLSKLNSFIKKPDTNQETKSPTTEKTIDKGNVKNNDKTRSFVLYIIYGSIFLLFVIIAVIAYYFINRRNQIKEIDDNASIEQTVEIELR